MFAATATATAAKTLGRFISIAMATSSSPSASPPHSIISSCGMSTTSSCADISSVMPSVGLGTYLLDKKDIPTVIPKAIELGYRRIDCAPVYFNEMEIGDALHHLLNNDKIDNNQSSSSLSSSSSITRQDLFITSKLPSPFHKRQHVEIALRKTLTDLRLDYLDLYLIHWPVAFHYRENMIDPTKRGYDNEDIDDSRGGEAIDPTVTLKETWLGMQDLVQQQLVKYIGLSNVPIHMLQELLKGDDDNPQLITIPPAVNQVELHPYLPQVELVHYCQRHGIHVQAYSPLGTPGYKGSEEPDLLNDPVIQKIATGKHSRAATTNITTTPAQVLISWALQRNTSVVCKSRSERHLKENLAAAAAASSTANRWLTPEEMKLIDSLNRNHRFFRPQDWWGEQRAPRLD